MKNKWKSLFSKFLSLGIIGIVLSACKMPPTPPDKIDGAMYGVSFADFTWKTENDFKRISEYFTDEENTGVNLVFRTDSNKRTGSYFVVRLDYGSVLPKNSEIKLRYILTGEKEIQEKIFVTPEFYFTGVSEILIGLTDIQWGKEIRSKKPLAWRLEIWSPDKKELLACRESFLWKK